MIAYPYGTISSPINASYYEIDTYGASPISLDDAKVYLKVTTTADDDLITALIDTVVLFAEKYTGREFRANVWTAYYDWFFDRMQLSRVPVDTIDSVEYLASGSLEAVDTDVYYLKKQPLSAYIVKEVVKSWPSDVDDREQAVKVGFTTRADDRLSIAITGMLHHLAFLYRNRGDCGEYKDFALDTAKVSGATAIYGPLVIPRV